MSYSDDVRERREPVTPEHIPPRRAKPPPAVSAARGRTVDAGEVPFPIGKWKGTPLDDVPGDYLLWFDRQPFSDDYWVAKEYIAKNRDAILERIVLGFGKHRGTVITEVPASYLLWLADQPDASDRSPDICAYVAKHRDDLEDQKDDERDHPREVEVRHRATETVPTNVEWGRTPDDEIPY